MAAQFLRMWRDAIALLDEQTEGSAATAYARLAQHGVGVTTTRAVQYWMEGIVLGPRDPESVRAVGMVTARSELIRHYQLVHSAIGEIRQWRIMLARKLLEYVRAGMALGPDTVVDARLGLRRTDLEEMTRIGRVTRITHLVPTAG